VGNPLLDHTARIVIGHRGASGYAPENTLPAFELAIRQGADAIELDVRVTADSVPVVIHDPTTDRTTDLSARVGHLTLAQLRKADAGARFTTDRGRSFPFRGKGIAVPTLVEVLRAFPRTCFLIDLKEAEAQAPVRRVLVEEAAQDRCVLAAEDAATLTEFCVAPFTRASARQEISALFWKVLFRRRVIDAAAYRLMSVPASYRGIVVPTRRFVAAARALGCPVHVWTVNHPARARRLWERGAAGILTTSLTGWCWREAAFSA
jgi:glycerophosphoryl diester phosphodiesterase